MRSDRPNAIVIDGTRFRDATRRQVILRGVNLGGDCKVPFLPDGHTYRSTDFADHRTVSFVGRPFPLDEADAHLRRIVGWGFNCLRLLTTWEAVEHAAPGIYDEAYLDYFAAICRRAGAHGLHVFIDFHQDVWSRMSGGDGAPGWTFEAAGLDFTRFHAADAAHLMQAKYDQRLGGRQAAFPQMSWAGNYRMPANGIMWTLFFAGAAFAPGCTVGDGNIQHWLQDHYIGAVRAVADRVADIDAVIGFDTLNEPGSGYIGHRLETPLSRFFGAAWSPLDGLAVASGLSREVGMLGMGGTPVGAATMNTAELPIWLPGREDPFRAGGAWDIGPDGGASPLNDDYFRRIDGRGIDLGRDCMTPFFHRVANTIRACKPAWLVFAEVDPFGAMRGETFPDDCPERTVNASHWYDLTTLVTKRFDSSRVQNVLTDAVIEGKPAIERSYLEGLSRIAAIGAALNGGAPTLIGEFGIPYDMNDADAYQRWAAGERGDEIWNAQATALELMYSALDKLLLSSTQWNYTASNRNDAMVGDGWNQEDLSIWSADQITLDDPIMSGGRAVAGFERPYAQAVQGTIVRQHYDRSEGRFELEFDVDPLVEEETRVFVPRSAHSVARAMMGDIDLITAQTGSEFIIRRVTEDGRVSITLQCTKTEFRS